MELIERVAATVRHNQLLRRADWLWDAVRPFYNRTIGITHWRGIERNMNGTDRMFLSPRLRGWPESYEPEVWAALMREVQPGDSFADVGACFAVYALAVAQRVGPEGRVVAFEPDGANFALAQENINLNGLAQRIRLVRAAVSDTEGVIHFVEQKGAESRIAADGESGAVAVDCVTLDGVFVGERLDVLKIDVEGFEEPVLRGAQGLLTDPQRGPRGIFLEVHPYAWQMVGTTSESLLRLLSACGYETYTLDGERVAQINNYGEVIARKTSG